MRNTCKTNVFPLGFAEKFDYIDARLDEIEEEIESGLFPELAKYLGIRENAETGIIRVSLLNYKEQVIDTKEITLTGKLIKNASLDLQQKKIVLNCLDDSSVDIDITDLINDYTNKTANLKSYVDGKVGILQQNIDASGHSITSVFENDILTTTLKDVNGNVLSTSTVEIDTGDKYIVSGEYDTNTKSIILHYNDETTVSISLLPLINSLPTKQDIADLQNDLSAETIARQNADTSLSNRVTAIENKGYITQDINTSSISVQYTKSKSKTSLVTEGTWNINILPSNELPLSSAYGNSYYICCGYNGVIMYSQDAIDWTLFAPKFTNEQFDKICYGNGYFLLMCYSTGHIYKAYNPNVWSLLTTIQDETITNLQYINNKFVLTGANGYLAYSDTGESFDKIMLSVNETVRAIAYGNSAYVLVGNNGLVMTSRDGVSWYNRTDNNFTQDYKGILFERGVFVAYTNTTIRYSTNYYSFINATIPSMNNYNIQQVICGESTFYAISTDNTNTIVLNSSDGKTFSSIYTINQGIYTECYGNDNLVLTNSSAYDLDLEIHWSYNKPSLADDEYLWGRSVNHLNNGDVLYSAAYFIFTPKTLSEFKNDMGFIDKDADDLTNYYDIPTTDDLLDDKQDDMDEITNAEINMLFN